VGDDDIIGWAGEIDCNDHEAVIANEQEACSDPCCGTGSILLEAQTFGIQAYGSDRNERSVAKTRENLAHFGYDGSIEHVDARVCKQTADALVTNFPYGRFIQADETLIRGILEQVVNLAPLAIYVSAHNITNWIQDAGYQDVEIYPVLKSPTFTRYIHLARKST